ncbi:MAG: tetratricopeptide repeat protein [Cyanobacteria bacterium P01_A01_bin.135]
MAEDSTIQAIRALLAAGDAHFQAASYQEALQQYQAARTRAEQAGNLRYAAFSINNIGLVYDALGQYEQACEKYGQALEGFSNLQGSSDTASDAVIRVSQATVTNNLGMANTNLKKFGEAADLYQAALSSLEPLVAQLKAEEHRPHEQSSETLQQLRSLDLDERTGQVWHNMGFNLSRQSRSAPSGQSTELVHQAIETYTKAIPLRKTATNQGETLNSLAFAYGFLLETTGNNEWFDKAIAALDRAIELFESSQPPNREGLATTYDTKGHLFTLASQQNQSLLTEAKAAYDKSLQVAEQILAFLDDVDKRKNYAERVRETYTYRDFLMVIEKIPEPTLEKLGIQKQDLIGWVDPSSQSTSLLSRISPESILSAIPRVVEIVDDLA